MCAGLLLSYGCGDDGTSTSGTTGDTTGEETTEDPDPSVGPTSVTTTMGATGSTGGTMGETGTTAGETETGVGPSTTESTIEPTTEDPSTTDNTTENPTTTTTGEPTTTDGTSTGDPTTGTTGDEPYCEFVDEKVSCDGDDNDPLKALGFNCDGDDYAVTLTPIVDIQDAPDSDSWRVVTGFGLAKDPDDPALPFWGPQEGEKFLVISTGDLRDPFMQTGLLVNGIDDASPGLDNDNPNDVGMLPAPVSPVDGSNNGQGGTPFQDCDGVNDCSDTLQAQWIIGNEIAHDVLHFGGSLTVPEDPDPLNATGYEFDFAYFSAEYPNFVDSQFNDVFLAWSTSETYTGNVTFIDGQPLTVTALQDNFDYNPNDPVLAGTGFDHVGGATKWFTAEGSATPGETFEIHFMIFDMGDPDLDTTVLLDNFHWVCEGCVPSEVMGCGIM
ncbi:MAG: choice-of-anchor L domain-containing protein [Myxococcales bacterium]|nr:choice-of-anchor L domain-containing protein [Myxococcales bacterium]